MRWGRCSECRTSGRRSWRRGKEKERRRCGIATRKSSLSTDCASSVRRTRGRSPPAGETGRSCNEAGRVALSGGVALLGIGFFIDFAAKITGAMLQDKGVALYVSWGFPPVKPKIE